MEDNGSGCALVLELARVMSTKNYRRTIVFMLTIGEEQGLDGADAFAKYCKANNLNIRAVFTQ
jgi:Zn-dependent M28 family amino/carboxypeptidase